jgi:hypothetical protein
VGVRCEEGLCEESLELSEDIHDEAELRFGLDLLASTDGFWPLTFSLLFLCRRL